MYIKQITWSGREKNEKREMGEKESNTVAQQITREWQIEWEHRKNEFIMDSK